MQILRYSHRANKRENNTSRFPEVIFLTFLLHAKSIFTDRTRIPQVFAGACQHVLCVF